MNYSFTVWPGGDGKLHIREYDGILPGHLQVSGREDADSATISVTRLDQDDRPVIQAAKTVRAAKPSKEPET